VRGMAAGASAARRTAMHKVKFDCKGIFRADGACYVEDVLWVRAMIKEYTARDAFLYVTWPMVYSVPRLSWFKDENGTKKENK
jgi:hypothetical protein